MTINKALGVLTYPPKLNMAQHISLSLSVLVFLSPYFFSAVQLGVEASSKSYIVYLGEKQHEDPNLTVQSHHEMLTSLLGSKEEALNSIIYSYKHGFSGFSAMLTESQAQKLSELPEVISVKLSRSRRLHTTRSWDFLGLDYYQPRGLLHQTNYGEDAIVGVIDSGIWPESRSFNDDGYGPIPSRWKGKCETGPSFGANNCSRKIIGARYYDRGVNQSTLAGEFLSPRDSNGHGTHTASTAAGTLVANVSFHGLAAGAARGGAPRARLAIYKACWGNETVESSCGDDAVLKAIDDAIHDGVDILSLSIGGQDEQAGSLHAVANGITVVFAAGNDGPLPQMVENSSPWVIAVAASMIDRSFPTLITLGNNEAYVGQSVFYKTKKDDSFNKLSYGQSCDASNFIGTNITGMIVLCFDLDVVSSRVSLQDIVNAVSNVLSAGGKGVIYAQYSTNMLLIGDLMGIPFVAVDHDIAFRILNYIDSGRSPMVKVSPTRTVVGKEVVSPKVAAFSSRGPSPIFPEVLKPDIAAPGHMILAAKGDSYVFESGTSMACPHVSGIAALLKSLHPDWSPAAIKSAIVTTASNTDGYGLPIEAEGTPRKLADPFDFGGGHIEPNRAADPGLIYDINPKDYLKFFNCTFDQSQACDSSIEPLYYLNLPSISIPNLKEEATVWRTVTNVGKVDAIYKAVVQSPPGTEMAVEPSVLIFNAAAKMQTFKVTFVSARKVQGDYTFGSLTWVDDDSHAVRIPVAVRTVIQEFYSDVS